MERKTKKASSRNVFVGSGEKKSWPNPMSSIKGAAFLMFMVIFAGVGAYYLLKSHAASPEMYVSSSAPVTIGTWNTYVDNKTKIGDTIPKYLSSADIIGMQEVHTTTERNSVKKNLICSTCAYEGVMYKNKNKGKKIDPRGGYPIIWKKGMFKRIGSYHLKKAASELKDGKIKFKARYIAWVTLQDMRTGKQFIVVNTHTYAKVEKNGGTYGHAKVNAGYQKHMATLVSVLKSLQKQNIPIFVLGDLNVDYKTDDGRMSWFPYANLTQLGFVSNWKLADYTTSTTTAATTSVGDDTLPATTDEDVTDPPIDATLLATLQGRHVTQRIIDYVYAWMYTDATVKTPRADVAFKQTDILGLTDLDAKGYAYGSDHTPVTATFELGDITAVGSN